MVRGKPSPFVDDSFDEGANESLIRILSFDLVTIVLEITFNSPTSVGNWLGALPKSPNS